MNREHQRRTLLEMATRHLLARNLPAFQACVRAARALSVNPDPIL
tara:strand:- start:408 stop:542 length:135 start_codon:yes stop_codon:yes gene_type:complete